MKKLLAVIIVSTCLTTTAFAGDMPRSTITSSQGAACKTMIGLASTRHVYIERVGSTTAVYVVRTGWDWLALTEVEKVSMLTALACEETGNFGGRLDMIVTDGGGFPIGQFVAGQLMTFPRSGFPGVGTVSSASQELACWTMLGLANRGIRLIVRSYYSTPLSRYIADVSDDWVRATPQQQVSTMMALACGAPGNYLIKDPAGWTVGRFVAGQLELY